MSIADEDDDFLNKLMQRDPEEAVKWYLLAAENGDCHAQIVLADTYWDMKRWEESASYYRQAAEGGDAGSQVMLGHMLYSGAIKGMLREMTHWYFQASETKWIARFMLGEIYRYGRGLPQNYEKAMHWFLDGDAVAAVQTRRLEACYAFFNASPSEYAQAFAFDSGHADSFKSLGRHNVWKELTQEQLAEGLRRLTAYENQKGAACKTSRA